MKKFKKFLKEEETKDLNLSDPTIPLDEVDAQLELLTVAHPDISAPDSPFLRGLLHPHHTEETFKKHLTTALEHAYNKDMQHWKNFEALKNPAVRDVWHIATQHPNPELHELAFNMSNDMTRKRVVDSYDKRDRWLQDIKKGKVQ